MAETGLLDHNSLSSHEIDYEEQYLPVEHETGRNASRYRTGRWDENEHRQFLQGLQIHGKNWKKIAELVKTRSSVQIRTHAQKFFIKASRQGLNVNYFSRIEQPKNEWTEEQSSSAVELPTGAEDEKNPLNIPLINEDGELFNGIPVQESSSYETKPIDNNRALEPLPIVDFDTTVMTVDDVCTPRMLNVNRLAPSLDEKINQTVHAERPYKRALDMDDSLNYFSFSADGFYAKAVNQVDAAAPLEFGDCTDLDDELSLVSSETPDVLSCDDNMAFDDKDLDFFFSDEIRECKKARLVAGF